MSDVLDVSYLKVGENRGNKRIWMQGENLTRAKFVKGTHYEVTYNIDTREILLDIVPQKTPTSRIDSGRKKPNGTITPIIELAKGELVEITQGSEAVRVDFSIGHLCVQIHHNEIKQEKRVQRLQKNLANGFITTGSVCSGIGVSTASISDGFKSQGVISKNKFIVDRERKYLDVAVTNNHAVTNETKVFEASLEELEPELLGYVDCLSFSLPCTGHSPSGKAKNGNKVAESHIDANAITGLLRIIDACQPSILISENVKAAKNSATYILLAAMLDACGYNIEERDLNSSNTHSIENRPRWWFVATTKKLNMVDLSCFPKFKKEFNSLADMLQPIPFAHRMWKPTDEKVRKAALNKANGKRFDFNLVDTSVTSIGVMGRHYQKDRATEPHIKGINNTMRLLTPIEVCKAQSVPLHLIDGVVSKTAYEGLGQGVDYRQAFGIASLVASQVILPLLSTQQKAA